MSRLVVNPDTPQAWEIQLKPGANTFGRNPTNDFTISDPSVSGSHCQITVTDDAAVIQDLDSTNGTFVNRAPVQTATLQSGQSVQLGGVEMVFYGGAGGPPTPSPPPAPPAARMRPAIRVAAPAAPADALPVAALVVDEPTADAAPPPLPVRIAAPPAEPPVAFAPEATAGTEHLQSGPRMCKFHSKSPAKYLCRKCNRSFCELCVVSRTIGGVVKKNCRSCGVECIPLHTQAARPKAAKGFYGRLPGVLIYPFRGTGLLVLIAGTLVLAGLDAMGGFFSVLIMMLAYGYLFSYMQNIIHATAAEEQQMPDLPGMDGLFGAFFTLLGTILIPFGVPIALLVARFFEVDIPTSAILITGILGSFYFPMAFLAVAMKDTVMAANPLIVFPSILKVPLEYFVTAILFASIFGISQLGKLLMSGVDSVTYSTTSVSVVLATLGIKAIWKFVSVYLLTVNMRILGLLYLTKKDKLGWFSR
jgi:hypothetical protein